MPIPENFKYDVRVRERMQRRGVLTEDELTKHVDALADVTDQVIEVELKQPALVKESEREARVMPRVAPRPIAQVPLVRSLENELNGIDDDEDDDLDDVDEEEDEEGEAKAKAAAPKAEAEKPNGATVEPAPEPAPAPVPKADPDDEGWGSET
ncbi:MAG TPA: hypothetical protein VGM44_05100 [Polyangiaceae bacterium]|jgi:hypothetical protein